MTQLDRKLFRDLLRMKGQAIAVSLVMACGLAMLIMARSLIISLETTRQRYYEENHFAQVFDTLKRAPLSLVPQIAAISGVSTVEPGIAVQVTLDIAGLEEPATGLVRSLPDFHPPELNQLFLRHGQWLRPGGRHEVLVGEAFAEANSLHPGDKVTMVLNGRLQTFRLAGIVLSPEFIFEARPGAALPDNRTYGIFWMPYEELANAFDLDRAFNHLSLSLAPGASEKSVIHDVDQLLEPYGGRGAHGRADHASHIRVSDEIRVLETLSIGFPMVFLSVAAFMTNAVLSRLLALQREQIAILKAFGFTNRQVGWHYVKFALVFVMSGTVLGMVGGAFLGGHLVEMYKMFFRFPDLAFRLDRDALLIAWLVGTLTAVAGVLGAVRRAAQLPPADAMRPEPPSSYRQSLLERTGIAKWLSHSFRIAVRNLERKPLQAFFTVAGLALATGILIVPNCFRDSVNEVLEFQWDTVQRHDVTVGLVEPDSDAVEHPLGQLPGVVHLETFRSAAARIRHGHQHRQLMIYGMAHLGEHERIIDAAHHEIEVPRNGLVVSSKLAEVLGAKPGDSVTLEFLDGRRKTVVVTLVGLSEDFAGLTARMERHALNRLLGEGDMITGATFKIDPAQRGAFLNSLKRQPRVSWVAVKESLRANFRKTTAASINLIQSIYLLFATVVAFGVVYNNTRISLAERARELATLRVVGFSQSEVGSVLVIELVLLALIAVPCGLLLGTGFATGIIGAVSTETIRLPLILSLRNYAFAVTVVTVAATLSALFVLRTLRQLNLVSALRAPE